MNNYSKGFKNGTLLSNTLWHFNKANQKNERDFVSYASFSAAFKCCFRTYYGLSTKKSFESMYARWFDLIFLIHFLLIFFVNFLFYFILLVVDFNRTLLLLSNLGVMLMTNILWYVYIKEIWRNKKEEFEENIRSNLCIDI